MRTDERPVRELFGFERDPFSADPARIWLDPERQEILRQLEGLVARCGFGVLTGPAGCGKTVLLGHLGWKLADNAHRVIYVACSECGSTDLLRLLSLGLNLEPPLGAARTTRQIHDRVAEMKGITPVIIIDEAQSLPQATLETLRVTCSSGIDGRCRFAVIIAGAEELLGRLALRVFEPLRQRITVYGMLTALNRTQTIDYVRHRFQSAGVERDVVAGEALNLLFEATGGVPRLIDKLLDEALRRAAREGAALIVLDHIHTSIRTVFGPNLETRQ